MKDGTIPCGHPNLPQFMTMSSPPVSHLCRMSQPFRYTTQFGEEGIQCSMESRRKKVHTLRRLYRNLNRLKTACPCSPLPKLCCQINLHKIQFSSFYSSDEKCSQVYHDVVDRLHIVQADSDPPFQAWNQPCPPKSRGYPLLPGTGLGFSHFRAFARQSPFSRRRVGSSSELLGILDHFNK